MNKIIKFKRISIIVYIAIAIAIISLILLKNSRADKTEESTRVEQTDEKVTKLGDEILTEIYNLRIQHPYIVYAQAIIESGNFSSKIFKENNNLFGMKLAYQRPTTAIRANRGHAVYSSWKESIIDYAIWQSIYARNLSEEEYFQKLQSIYAQDEVYVKKIQQIKNKIIKE